ncbi:GA-binding subunit beta-1-like [Brachionus plicatilis]|uniref:GA-binding subunit beta-1-like n=1 Tax=Brachionus plicatilis TaxID=10195 RepID=A0A3M7PAP0_BRAPC|nr:GA-binding subunit beta-1-like [Brachionus plicatilis]
MKTKNKSYNNESMIRAVKDKNLQKLKNILETSKCSLNYSNKDGMNALHLATSNNDLEMVSYLINQKVDLDSRSNLNRTALHYACQGGYLDIASLLVENNSDVNAIDFLDMTPLHMCAEKNNNQIAKILCKSKNIKLDTYDRFNRTSYSIARSNKNSELIKILEDLKNELNKEKKYEANNTDLDLSTQLSEFYKKKSFARPISRSTKEKISNFYAESLPEKTLPSCSAKSSKSKPKYCSVESNESSSDSDCHHDINKKKKLSSSPNFVDNNLNWMTNQSNIDISNVELSLTEAGKLTLDYLNKIDPIGDEQRLLMKLMSDLENDEKDEINDMIVDEEDQNLEKNFFNLIKDTDQDDNK